MFAARAMKRLLFNLKWHLFKPSVFLAFREAMQSQFMPIDELETMAEAKKRAIVRHAYEHTAFYRKFYSDAGFSLADIGKDGWFEHLPVLRKEHLRKHFNDFIDQSQRLSCAISTTGGSTGVPTKTGYDKRFPFEAMSWRLQNWFGINPWDDHAYVWRQSRSGVAQLVNAMIWWPTRHLKLDASIMNEQTMRAFLLRYNRVRPSLLQGYVGAIVQLSQYVIDHKLTVYFPKCVWVTSAPITEVQKQLVRKAFHAPILDQYGSCEVTWIAQSCLQDCGLHVNVERICIEYVDGDNRPMPVGEYGKALLTNLVDTVFPIIRYENGDRGRWLGQKCPCGRTLPLIDSVKGRETESFILPSGKIVSGEYLTTIFDSTPDIVRGFRVVQHGDLSITVECVPSCESVIPHVRQVVEAFSRKIGDEVSVDCAIVQTLPHDRGKIRFVVKE